MAKVIYTANYVRNDFFNLVDMVAATGNPVYIKKGREINVRLAPVNKKDFEDIEGLKFFKLRK